MSNKEGSKKIQNVYDLSPMQSGMLFHSLLDKESGAYKEQFVLTIEGEIDAHLLEKSFNLLIERYDIFRTAFVYENFEEPVQVVLKRRTYRLPFEDISHLSRQEELEYFTTFMSEDREKGFDLSKELLMRVFLFKTGKNLYKLIWTFHHIIMDGWCLGIVYRDWTRLYLDLRNGKSPGLESVTQYRHYIKWLQRQDKTAGLSYWREYLEEYEHRAALAALDNPVEAEAGERYRLEVYSFSLDDTVSARVIQIARENRVTPNLLFQALWGILLQNYNNVDDVVYGAIVSGRPPGLAGIESMVGLFINTVPVRVKVENETTLPQLLEYMYKDAAASKFYEYLTLADIQAESLLKGHLIDHIMAFENYPLQAEIKNAGIDQKLGFRTADIQIREQSNYDFNLVISPGTAFTVKFNYNALVYSGKQMERTALHFKQITEQVIHNPGIKIKDIEMVTAAERRQLLLDFNRTAAGCRVDKTIHELFEEQVEKTPWAIAVEESLYSTSSGQLSLTYRELNDEACRLAGILVKGGIKPGIIAGLLMERSIHMATAILGILKTGAAYLPIDPGCPGERMRYMLEDSGAKVLITTGALAKEVNKLEVETIFMEKSCNRSYKPHMSYSALPAGLAYVIYTSGTTGRPKGVTVEHQGVVNMLLCRKDIYKMGKTHVALQLFSYAFDGFITGFFTPIISGSRVILPDDNTVQDVGKIIGCILRKRVTHFIAVPPLYRAIIDLLKPGEAACLQVVVLAGDILQHELLEKTKEKNKNLEIVNEYGVTEGSVMSTFYRHQERDRRIKIGKPIWNTMVCISDRRFRLQPVGLWGEMCIAGVGLARGYLNNPELTAERFASGGPLFSKSGAKTFHEGSGSEFPSPGGVPVGRGGSAHPHDSPLTTRQRLYRTGDLARWLPDGNIEFLGRIDRQVKIRGYRIELGEIEDRLLSIEGIKEAVVTDREDKAGQRYLCAYIVAQSAARVREKLVLPREEEYPEIDKRARHAVPGSRDSVELRERLSRSLPAYMIPGLFVQIDRLPLTPNGKIDRKALPLPEMEAGENYTAPRDEIEKKMVELWSKVLGIEKEVIGIDDNFFELGGHSLKATIILGQIHQAFQVKVQLTDIFETPYIREIASLIKTIQIAVDTGAGTGRETEEMVL